MYGKRMIQHGGEAIVTLTEGEKGAFVYQEANIWTIRGSTIGIALGTRCRLDEERKYQRYTVTHLLIKPYRARLIRYYCYVSNIASKTRLCWQDSSSRSLFLLLYSRWTLMRIILYFGTEDHTSISLVPMPFQVSLH